MNTRMEFTPMPLCLGLTPFPVPHYLDGLQGGESQTRRQGLRQLLVIGIRTGPLEEGLAHRLVR